jgi:membrane protein
MRPESPETPEARRKHPEAHPHKPGWFGHIGPGSRPFELMRRVVIGVFNDGFLHAGNLAYLSLLTLFPFFIVMAAVAQAIGRPEENLAAIHSMLVTLPPSVRTLIQGAAEEVLLARTGPLLWFGAAVGLWTVTSFVETIRDILRRAYGTDYGRPFWHYRLAGIVIVVFAVTLIMFAFSAQIALTATEEVVARYIPLARRAISADSQWITINLAIFGGLFVVFWALTPAHYRRWAYPKWPGALFTTLWWSAALSILPRAINLFGGYALTYGSLAGVIVALLFFWIVGFGLVIGAHLNAALANPDEKGLKGRALDELSEAQWLDT